jgi:hypothetical protein
MKTSKTVEAKSEFDTVLVEAIDDALSAVGSAPKVAICLHLEKKYGMEKALIPQRIDDFSNALEEIFGLGARHLEILIMKYLHAKIGNICEIDGNQLFMPDFTFKEYVTTMRLNFNKATQKKDDLEVLIVDGEKKVQYN